VHETIEELLQDPNLREPTRRQLLVFSADLERDIIAVFAGSIEAEGYDRAA
jgi:hypothetical protein